MAYHNVEQNFARMHIQDGSKKLPPALAPKPKPYTAAPTPYRPAGAVGYRPVYPDQDFPPPPSQPGFPVSDDGSFPPPPPPPDTGRGGYGYPEDDFPPPPPTTGPVRYDPHPQGGGGVYRAQPHHISPAYPEEYRRSPRDFGRSEGRMSPYSAQAGTATYMNIGPNPPPLRDEDEFIHPSQVYRAKPVITQHTEKPVPGPQVPAVPGSPSPASPKGPGHSKEAEVDALTSLLVQSMESSSDPDFFGMCSKCSQKVLGEINGCTAMDQIYHIGCFTCVNCGNRLQGKSFFAVETKPYCEPCYMNTLEKCSVCSSPITDRLLRATGKPYHPACFTCVVCGKSLDGVPFTVDATNQIHCIEDFHKKFAPRCCVCQHPIMPEPGQEETIRIVAMDRSFHVQCYRCEDCGMQLSSEEEGRGCYPLDDHILCKNCNAKRIQKMTTKIATEL